MRAPPRRYRCPWCQGRLSPLPSPGGALLANSPPSCHPPKPCPRSAQLGFGGVGACCLLPSSRVRSDRGNLSTPVVGCTPPWERCPWHHSSTRVKAPTEEQ